MQRPITMALVVAVLLSHAQGAETAPARSGEWREQLIKRFDRDGDGRLDPDERESARKAIRERSAQASRPAAAPITDGMRVLRDLEYANVDGRTLRLDAYLPTDAVRPLPVVIWIHGGGWQSGSKERCPAVLLVPEGFAVFSINYRLTDVAAFPAQIHDCKGAIRWIRAHAGEYGLDPGHLGVWGASAGGHLAALLGTSGGIQELEGDVGANLDQSSRVQAVCDFCGPTSFRAEDLDDAAPRPGRGGPQAVQKLLGGPMDQKQEKARLASPIEHVTHDDPSFLIVHGAKDTLVQVRQARLLTASLEKAGVRVSLHILPDAGHDLAGGQTFPLVRDFFRRTLLNQTSATAPAS